MQCRCTGSSKQKCFVYWAQALSMFSLLLNSLCILLFSIKSSTAPGWMLLSSYVSSPPLHLLLLCPLQRALITASLSLCRWHCSGKLATCTVMSPHVNISILSTVTQRSFVYPYSEREGAQTEICNIGNTDLVSKVRLLVFCHTDKRIL